MYYRFTVRNLIRILIAISAALVLLGIAMPYYGRRYGEHRTSVRAVDGFGREFDSVISEWDHRAYYVIMVAVFLGLLPMLSSPVRRLYLRYQSR
jgi:hypothetical protein